MQTSNEILVSVIIPAYNCEKYISKSIYSALSQEVPLEILVINDCATDGTDEAVKPYLDNPAVRYIQNEKNMGVAKTRNRGVQLARGKYVAFLDSDDWWENGKLKKQLDLMEKEDVVLCCTGRDLMNPDGTFMGKSIPVSEKITYRDLLKHNCINCSSVLLVRSVALEFPMEHEDSRPQLHRHIQPCRRHLAGRGKLLRFRQCGLHFAERRARCRFRCSRQQHGASLQQIRLHRELHRPRSCRLSGIYGQRSRDLDHRALSGKREERPPLHGDSQKDHAA